ncbi:hypothetical protein [Halobacillus sp. A5]|uniref:hypothetical protein n=1 Tax=Halobacillus sp. A5 TaxID=2880263 RepID=UPI0020A61DAB|nr:hypothetical protein [Halobacillus sp. A5]MCP3026887.1 hypothetical protein [Halobacillus sp. A5]
MSTTLKWAISVLAVLFILTAVGAALLMQFTSGQSEEVDQQEIKETFNQSEGEDGEEAESADEMSFEGSVPDFVAEAHNFYNKTLGWGNDSSLDEDLQLEFAALIETYFNENSTDEIAEEDIDQIVQLASGLSATSNFNDDVIELHRYFHDLDIAINDYSDYDKVWGVTETYGSGN